MEAWSNEAEMAVLGAILVEPRVLDDVSALISARDFYAEKHGAIYRALQEMAAKGEGIDALTVAEHMGGAVEHIGGVQYLVKLMHLGGTVAAAGAETHARVVRDRRIRRDLLRVGQRILELAQNEPELERAISEAETALNQIATTHNSTGLEHLGQVMLAHWQEMYEARHSSCAGLGTGLRPLDSALGGLHRSDLIVLAARPGQGKSALVTQIAYSVARDGGNVGMFSLEMSGRQIAERLVAGVGRIDTRRLRLRRLDDAEWDTVWRTVSQIAPYPIYVDDSAILTPTTLLARARRMKAKQGLDLVIVDYLQLMQADGRRENRQQEIAEISRLLKGLARDLDVPVLACSQLSRAVEQRAGREPELSDLRESGAIEQDADIVAFLHRTSNDLSSVTYPTDVLVKKHRHGPIGKCKLVFVPNRVMFAVPEGRHSNGKA